MGFIIVGIMLAIALSFLAVRVADEELSDFLIILTLLVFASGICAGIFASTGGYKPLEEVQTVELQALTDKTTSTGKGSLFYVSVNASNAYTYYMQIESIFAGENSKAYASKSISGNNITIVEEEKCQIPRLTEYKQDPYITFWSFAVGNQKKIYVFYVPKGTIAHEITLGQ